jgi:hypothetical protein
MNYQKQRQLVAADAAEVTEKPKKSKKKAKNNILCHSTKSVIYF